MKHYETVRVTPIHLWLEAGIAVSMPVDSASVTVQEFETVQAGDPEDPYDYFGLSIEEF